MTSEVEKAAIESVYGIWYMDYSERNRASWFLHRSSGWGRILDFKENGEFEDRSHAPCGTGAHFWKGIWRWNEAARALFIQIKTAGGISPNIEPSEHYKKGVTLCFKEESGGELLLIPADRGIELEIEIR